MTIETSVVSGGIIFIVYHVVCQDHVIKSLCDLLVRAFHRKSPACQMDGHIKVEIKIFY